MSFAFILQTHIMDDKNSDSGGQDNKSTYQGLSNVPPVGHEELEKFTLLQKLNLAHEIGLDQSFSLKKDEPADNSLKKLVTDVVHSAYWDIFQEQISSDPPNLTMALSLLNEIKEGLYDVMMPHQVKLKNEVDETLDIDLLKQQALHGALDVLHFAQYILKVMRMLCAPARDQNISELMNETNIVSLYKGILDTLQLMKIDMANFTLFSIRPELVSNHMEYERQKFADYLKLSGESLPITEAWLSRHVNSQGADRNIKDTLYDAFLELLVWDNDKPYPETLILDEKRLIKLKEDFYLIKMTATIVLLSFNSVPPQLLSDLTFKENIKNHVSLLLDGINTDSKLSLVIQNVVDQLKKDINGKLAEREIMPLNEDQAESLSQQILPVVEPDNRIRVLVRSRVLDYMKLTIKHPGGKTNFPPALVLFKNELEALCNSFMNIVLYNINICFEHYKKIFNNGGSPSTSSP